MSSTPGCVRGTLVAGRLSRTPSRPRETRGPPRFWIRFRVASARLFRAPAVPDEPPEPAEKGRGDIRRSAIARGFARFAPDGSSAIIAHNSRVATSLGSRDSLAASSHGSTFRRANADMTFSTIPFSSSPIGVKRNSSNLCSKRNSECISGISMPASRWLSGREATLRLRPGSLASKPSRAQGAASDSENTQSGLVACA